MRLTILQTPFTPLKNGGHHIKFRSWTKNRRWVPTFVGMLGFMLVSGCSSSTAENDLAFKCFANPNETDVKYASVYIVNTSTSVARKVSNKERLGKAEISESIMKLNFKGDTKSFPLEVRINRYTGSATHEHGQKPLGQFASENAFYEMTCEKIEKKKL